MKFNRAKFWDSYREEFAHVIQSQVEAIEFLLGEFEDTPVWLNVFEISYALGTIKHETANTFEPIIEHGAKIYFNKYENKKSLGNNEVGDGFKFRGRGYVQLTGRRNYTLFEQKTGEPLTKKPDLVLAPYVAFDILTAGMHEGLFTGKKLSDYINSHTQDYKNARRIINGTDRADLIAGYADSFEQILKHSIDAQSNQPTQQAQTAATTAKSANAEENQSENINPLDSAANSQTENQTPPPDSATQSDNETASNSQISSEQSSVETNTESKAAQILPGNVSLESSQTKGQQPQIAENITNVGTNGNSSDADKIKAAQSSEDTVAEAHTHTGFLGKAGAIVAGIATGTYTIPAFAQSDTFLNGLFTGLEGLFHGLFVMRYILIGSLSLWFVIHKIESITIRLAAIKINSDPTLANVSIVQTPRKGLYTRIHEYLFGV